MPATPAASVSAKELFVLGRLSMRPTHGHEIMRTLTESRADLWVELSEKHVYYILKKLERAGLISARPQESGGRPARHVYSLTPAGDAEFRRQLTAEQLTASLPYSEFDVVFGMLAYTDCLTPAEKTAICEARIAKLEALVAEAAGARAAAAGAPTAATRFSARVFDRMTGVAKAEIAWLTDVLAEVERDGWPEVSAG